MNIPYKSKRLALVRYPFGLKRGEYLLYCKKDQWVFKIVARNKIASVVFMVVY